MSNDFLVPYGYGIEPKVGPKVEGSGGSTGRSSGGDVGDDGDGSRGSGRGLSPLRRMVSGGKVFWEKVFWPI